MDLLLKVIGIAFVAVVSFSLLRSSQPQIASLVIVAAGVLILLVLTDSIVSVVTFFADLSQKTGIDAKIFSSVLKIIGIGYLTEYSLSLCEDSGCSSLGKKIELCGKIVILLSSIPILTQIIQSIGTLM